MESPIEDGKYVRRDMVAQISDDFSEITITKNGGTVVLSGSEINDIVRVLEQNLFVDGMETGMKRFTNFCGTSLSLPNAEF